MFFILVSFRSRKEPGIDKYKEIVFISVIPTQSRSHNNLFMYQSIPALGITLLEPSRFLTSGNIKFVTHYGGASAEEFNLTSIEIDLLSGYYHR